MLSTRFLPPIMITFLLAISATLVAFSRYNSSIFGKKTTTGLLTNQWPDRARRSLTAVTPKSDPATGATVRRFLPLCIFGKDSSPESRVLSLIKKGREAASARDQELRDTGELIPFGSQKVTTFIWSDTPMHLNRRNDRNSVKQRLRRRKRSNSPESYPHD